MKGQRTFLWYDDVTGEFVYISHLVMHRSGTVVLIPDEGASVRVQPSQLSGYRLAQLAEGVGILADFARSTADRLDKTATRLADLLPPSQP